MKEVHNGQDRIGDIPLVSITWRAASLPGGGDAAPLVPLSRGESCRQGR